MAGGTCCGLSQQFTVWEGPWYQSEEVWHFAQSQAFHPRNVTRDFSGNLISFRSYWSGHLGSFLSDVCDALVVCQHGATLHHFF